MDKGAGQVVLLLDSLMGQIGCHLDNMHTTFCFPVTPVLLMTRSLFFNKKKTILLLALLVRSSCGFVSCVGVTKRCIIVTGVAVPVTAPSLVCQNLVVFQVPPLGHQSCTKGIHVRVSECEGVGD